MNFILNTVTFFQQLVFVFFFRMFSREFDDISCAVIHITLLCSINDLQHGDISPVWEWKWGNVTILLNGEFIFAVNRYSPSEARYLKLNHSLLFLRSNTFAFWLKSGGSSGSGDELIFKRFGSITATYLISGLQSTKWNERKFTGRTLYLIVFAPVSFLFMPRQ